MSTLGLNPETWDLCADENGNWPALSECEAVVQNIRACLQTCRGEWFLDPGLGAPLDLVLGANPDLDLYEAELKAIILAVPGVDRLTNFTLDRENGNRRVCANFTGVTDCGDEFGVAL